MIPQGALAGLIAQVVWRRTKDHFRDTAGRPPHLGHAFTIRRVAAHRPTTRICRTGVNYLPWPARRRLRFGILIRIRHGGRSKTFWTARTARPFQAATLPKRIMYWVSPMRRIGGHTRTPWCCRSRQNSHRNRSHGGNSGFDPDGVLSCRTKGPILEHWPGACCAVESDNELGAGRLRNASLSVW